MLDALLPAKAMLGDRNYDADRLRAALIAKGIAQCIPSKRNRKVLISPHREQVRQAQGLVPHPHPLRPLRIHLLLSHRHRRYRHLLALTNES